jgi:hypothetical protein
MTTERCFPDATPEQLRAAALACRRAVRGGDEDWDSPEAEEARRRTADLGWAWDFTTWTEAEVILEAEAELAAEESH